MDEHLTLAIALAEDGTGWDLEQTATRASGTVDEWALTGTKTLVAGAEAARVVLVTARDGAVSWASTPWTWPPTVWTCRPT